MLCCFPLCLGGLVLLFLTIIKGLHWTLPDRTDRQTNRQRQTAGRHGKSSYFLPADEHFDFDLRPSVLYSSSRVSVYFVSRKGISYIGGAKQHFLLLLLFRDIQAKHGTSYWQRIEDKDDWTDRIGREEYGSLLGGLSVLFSDSLCCSVGVSAMCSCLTLYYNPSSLCPDMCARSWAYSQVSKRREVEAPLRWMAKTNLGSARRLGK